jgi:hypothetical protein
MSPLPLPRKPRKPAPSGYPCARARCRRRFAFSLALCRAARSRVRGLRSLALFMVRSYILQRRNALFGKPNCRIIGLRVFGRMSSFTEW